MVDSTRMRRQRIFFLCSYLCVEVFQNINIKLFKVSFKNYACQKTQNNIQRNFKKKVRVSITIAFE